MLEDENKQLETNETPEGVDMADIVAEEIKDVETSEVAAAEETVEDAIAETISAEPEQTE